MEASLQEQLLEQFHNLVLSRAVAAGSTGRSQSALAAAAEAAELLRPILAVLPAAGAAGSACLGRACAALHSKKRLKGQAIATGLQTIIQQLTAEGEEHGVTNQYCHVAPDMAPDLNVESQSTPTRDLLCHAVLFAARGCLLQLPYAICIMEPACPLGAFR